MNALCNQYKLNSKFLEFLALPTLSSDITLIALRIIGQ